MRFIAMVRATAASEAEEGPVPDDASLLSDMIAFNDRMVQAGVMLAGEGLQPSRTGARVRFSGDKRSVIDGPFSETKELIAGFWILRVQSREEAIEWIKQSPNPFPGMESEIEIRRIYEDEDFGDALTPELREAEARQREQMARGQQQNATSP